MARIRTIKPEFFLDEKIADLSYRDRLAFIGLWLLADSEGRLKDEIKKVKIQILPYDQEDFDEILNNLAQKKLITRYEVEGKKYLKINNFSLHQKIHHTEKNSILPDINGYLTVKEPLKNGDARVGREGKGKEGSNGVIKIYCELFKGRYKQNPVITAKDAGIALRISTLPLNVPLLLKKYFESNDKFIIDNKHSMNIIESQANKIMIEKKDWRQE